jgi:hypothetical protein
MPMDLLHQGADQGFSVQVNPVLGLDLGDDFGDMKGVLGSSEYVYSHVHIRHTVMFFEALRLWGFGRLELSNDTELSRK